MKGGELTRVEKRHEEIVRGRKNTGWDCLGGECNSELCLRPYTFLSHLSMRSVRTTSVGLTTHDF